MKSAKIVGGLAALGILGVIAVSARQSGGGAVSAPPIGGDAPPPGPLDWIPFAAYRLPAAERIAIATARAAVDSIVRSRMVDPGRPIVDEGPRAARPTLGPSGSQQGPWWIASDLAQMAGIIGGAVGGPGPETIDEHERVEVQRSLGVTTAEHFAAYIPPRSIVERLLQALPSTEERARVAALGLSLARVGAV